MIYKCPECGCNLIGYPVNPEIKKKVYWCYWCNKIVDVRGGG